MFKKNREELQLLQQRLWIPLHYCNEALFAPFDSPVAGIGIKAIMNIPAGTPIISEQELFSVAGNARILVGQSRMAGFRSLSKPYPNSSPQQRFEANSFAMDGSNKGIFVQASRFNHSCVPNAHYSWNMRTQRLTIHAIIDIPADAEIFINYCAMHYLKTTKERDRQLRMYNFHCKCPACKSGTDFQTASEARRSKMCSLKAELDRSKDATQLPKRTERLNKIKTFGLLLQQEGLFYPQLANILAEEAKWYRREMDYATSARQFEGVKYKAALRLEALQIARKKLDMDVCCSGYESDEVEETLRFIEELKAL